MGFVTRKSYSMPGAENTLDAARFAVERAGNSASTRSCREHQRRTARLPGRRRGTDLKLVVVTHVVGFSNRAFGIAEEPRPPGGEQRSSLARTRSGVERAITLY